MRLVVRPERVMGARLAFADTPAAVGYVAELIRSEMPVARCELVDAAAGAVHPGMSDEITDAAAPVSRLAGVMEVALASVTRLGVPSILIGHAGDGNFHLVLFFSPDDAEVRRRVEVAYDELVRAALAAGGTCTGEHGVGLRKLAYVRAEHGEAVDVMWAIKDALDPAGIMNPGEKLPPRSA